MAYSLRTVAERLVRGVVLRRYINVRNKKIPLFVTPDSQLKYLKCWGNSFDRDLIRIAERFVNSDSIVWDVGANVGVFTFAAVSLADNGVLIALEPDTWLAGLMRRSARLSEYRGRDIRIVPAAVSDRNGIAKFMIAKRGRASNSLAEVGGRSQMGGVRELQYVPTITLDTLLTYMPAPDFVKIDIEGAELMALHGAVQLINNIRPSYYIEVGGNVSDDLYTVFHAASYRAYDGVSGEHVGHCAPNTCFIPEERSDVVASLF